MGGFWSVGSLDGEVKTAEKSYSAIITRATKLVWDYNLALTANFSIIPVY